MDKNTGTGQPGGYRDEVLSKEQILASLRPGADDVARQKPEPTKREFYELGERIASALELIAERLGEHQSR